MTDAPKRFVGLHSHSGFSLWDGLGYPDEHQNFALENGMDALALTDHGNMNGFPYAHQNAEKMNKAGKKFKYLPGVEAYYHPDLKEWESSRAQQIEDRKNAKKSSFSEEEETGGENEEETKSVPKQLDPVKRRHHLVLLPTSSKGLKNLFTLVSRSFKEGFYKFPRIDRAMLKEHGEDIIATTACVGSIMTYDIMNSLRDKEGRDASLLDDSLAMEKALAAVGNTFDQLTDALGVGNVYPEIQFNKLDIQHTTNRVLLEFCKRNGIKPVATADSHYCRPELWASREIYKRLGRIRFEQLDPSLLPKDVSELKCELYPKNAQQMWDSYKETSAEFSWYEDDIVKDAIERTWDIAHNVIGDVQPDRALKLPNFLVPPGIGAFEYLVELCKEGLIQRGLHKKKKYIERLKYELETIRGKNFSLYFITMKSIIDIAKKTQLVGCGRGSGCGSLVNYVLGITGLDPFKYDLLFSRFISPSRCLDPKTYVRVSETESKQISDLKINDTVMTETGTATVVATQETDHDLRYTLTVAGNKIKCSSDHRWIAMRNGSRVELRTHELTTDDELIIDDEISLTRKI